MLHTAGIATFVCGNVSCAELVVLWTQDVGVPNTFTGTLLQLLSLLQGFSSHIQTFEHLFWKLIQSSTLVGLEILYVCQIRT